MAIFPFRRRVRLDSLRGKARPGRPADLEAHRARQRYQPRTPYPGPPPGVDQSYPVQRYFPHSRPDRIHLWFDQRFTAPVNITTSASLTTITLGTFRPPPRWRAMVQKVGWAADCQAAQGVGKLGYRVNGAFWRDYFTALAEDSVQARQDANFFGVSPYIFTTDQAGLHDDDLVDTYLDLAENDSLVLEVVFTAEGLGTRIHGRVKGWFYQPNQGAQQ